MPLVERAGRCASITPIRCGKCKYLAMNLPGDQERRRLDRLAAQVERDLYGLTVAQAEARLSRYPGLSLLAVGLHEPEPAYYVAGEITVHVDGGRILDPANIEEVD